MEAPFCPARGPGKSLCTVPGLFLETKQEDSMSSTLYTTEEAASYLKLAISTLEHWRIAGRGPAYVRVGNQVRYRPQDIEDYLEQQLVRA